MDQKYPRTTGQAPPGYPAQQGYPTAAPYPQQPEQPVPALVAVVPQQQQPVTVLHVQSFVGHIVFACAVFWCCSNWLFGGIAFILAIMASSRAATNPAGARGLGNASIGVSVAGIVVTVVLVIVVVAVNVSAAATAAGSCNYLYQGTCYRHKDYVGQYGYCPGVRSSGGYCYYN